MDTETLESGAPSVQKTHNSPARIIAVAAIVLACVVAAGFLPAIKTPIARIGLGFIPLVAGSMLLPVPYTVVIAILGDIIKYFLFNASFGPLNPGITLGAGVAGLIYGLAFAAVRRDDFTFGKRFVVKAVLGSALTVLIADILINTVALSFQLGKGWIAILIPWRLISEGVMFAVHIPVVIGIGYLIAQYKTQYKKS